MKISDIVETLDNINEARMVLISTTDEGTFISKDFVEIINKLLGDYESYILGMEVLKR